MVEIRRLRRGDETVAAQMMAAVFKEDLQQLPDEYLQEILSRDSFWAIAAFDGAQSAIPSPVTHFTFSRLAASLTETPDVP
jgi:hypothetical protein